MAMINAQDVRIPKHAREAVAHHEEVIVINRERPAYVIVHPEDRARSSGSARRGRPLRDALSELGRAASPDSAFAEDMAAVLDSVGPTPGNPWPQS